MELILNDISEFIIDCEHNTAPIQDFGYPSIRTPNVGKGVLLLDGVNRVSEDIYIEWTRRGEPQEGDLIIAREAPVGNVAIIPKNLKVCLGQRTVLVRPDKSIVNPQYLCYLLLGDKLQSKILTQTTGATVAHLNMKDIRELKLPKLPTLPIQRKIASILSAYDELIENNKQRIRLLEEMTEEIYKEWFVRLRFPGYETVKIIDGMPEGWEEKEFKFFGDIITGKTPSTLNEDFFNGEVPFVKTPDMSGSTYVIETTETLSVLGADSQNKKFIPKNSLLVSCIGSAGVYALASKKCQTNQQINSIVFYEEYYSFYFYCFAKKLRLILQNLGSNGATMTNVNKSKFEKMKAIYPGKKLLSDFHKLIKNNFELILYLQLKNQLLRQTRDLLLPRLISGKLSVEHLVEEEEAGLSIAAEPEVNYQVKK